MNLVRLYLDDVRLPPDDGGGPWTVCRTVAEAQAVLLAGPVEEASLDHDLGTCESCRSNVGPLLCTHVPDGRALLRWMAAEGRWPRLKPRCHSSNLLYGPEMVAMIERDWKAPPRSATRCDESHVHELSTVDDYLEALGGHGQFPDDIAGRVRAFDKAALRAYISACSEEYDCASWDQWFTEQFWRQMVGKDVDVAPGYRVQMVRKLHERAGGWWHWPDGADGPVFVEAEEWERRMAR